MNTINAAPIQLPTPNPITIPSEDTPTPEEEAQAREESLNNAIGVQEELQDQNDLERQVLVASVEHQSKQTQREIYLAVALEQDVNLQRDNQYMLDSLQRTQEQNNAVKAYAAYAEANTIVAPKF